MGRKDLGRYQFKSAPFFYVQAILFCTFRPTCNLKFPSVVYLDERDGTYHVKTQAYFLDGFALCPKDKATGRDGSS